MQVTITPAGPQAATVTATAAGQGYGTLRPQAAEVICPQQETVIEPPDPVP